MTEENIPTMAASHEEFAAWLISLEPIKEEMKRRLGKEYVNTYAEIEEGDEKVYLKECEKCDMPKITHQSLNIGCTMLNKEAETLTIQTGDLLKQLIKNQEVKEKVSIALMEEIEKLPEFEQAKTLLEELKTRTCICKKVCVNERGLQVHKRKCQVSKNAITRESSTASTNNENTMMLQLMRQMNDQQEQMKEDRRIQQEQMKEERKAQKEQNNLLAKLLEEKDKTANEMLKKVSENHLEQQRIANVISM